MRQNRLSNLGRALFLVTSVVLVGAVPAAQEALALSPRSYIGCTSNRDVASSSSCKALLDRWVNSTAVQSVGPKTGIIFGKNSSSACYCGVWFNSKIQNGRMAHSEIASKCLEIYDQCFSSTGDADVYEAGESSDGEGRLYFLSVRSVIYENALNDGRRLGWPESCSAYEGSEADVCVSGRLRDREAGASAAFSPQITAPCQPEAAASPAPGLHIPLSLRQYLTDSFIKGTADLVLVRARSDRRHMQGPYRLQRQHPQSISCDPWGRRRLRPKRRRFLLLSFHIPAGLQRSRKGHSSGDVEEVSRYPCCMLRHRRPGDTHVWELVRRRWSRVLSWWMGRSCIRHEARRVCAQMQRNLMTASK